MTDRTAAVWTDRDAITGDLALKALQFVDINASLIARSKQPGFDAEREFEELAVLFDTERFRRKSKDRAPIDWPNYRPILSNWAAKSSFWYKFKRATQVGHLAFLELEEHITLAGAEERVEHTLTAFEFDDAGKMIAVEVYFMIS